VISSDRISPSLKTKRHYNSFRTDLGFFVHLTDVERWVEEDSFPVSALLCPVTGNNTEVEGTTDGRFAQGAIGLRTVRKDVTDHAGAQGASAGRVGKEEEEVCETLNQRSAAVYQNR
jgi:hypothetical protein